VTVVDINRTQLVLQAVTSSGEVIDRMTLAKASGNQAPALSAFTPASATAGALGFTLTVTGSGFLVDSVVRWNGEDRPTTFVSTSELQAAIPASDLTSGENIEITVFNAPPSEGISNKLAFSIADFGVKVSPDTATVSPGQSASYVMTVSPLFGSYDNSISLACSGLPSLSSCNFFPTTLTPGSSDDTSTLTISTTTPAASLWPALGRHPEGSGYFPWLGLSVLAVVVLLFAGRTHRKPLRLWLSVALLVFLVATQMSCGGEPQTATPRPGTPTGSFTITISGTSGSLQHTATVTLTVQ
jgi:hypothetical protein